MPEGGKYKVVLSSDEAAFGGRDRVTRASDHLSHPEGEPGVQC